MYLYSPEKFNSFCQAYGYDKILIAGLLTEMITRINALLEFIYLQAKNHNVKYKNCFAEGYDKLYFEDICYIKSNQQFFKDYLQVCGS